MGICSVSGVRGIPVESHKQKWENSVGESLFFQIIPIVSFFAWRYLNIYKKRSENKRNFVFACTVESIKRRKNRIVEE